MGWLVVTSIGPLVDNLAPGGLWLLVAGGLAYTVGTAFYVLERIHYMHASGTCGARRQRAPLPCSPALRDALTLSQGRALARR